MGLVCCLVGFVVGLSCSLCYAASWLSLVLSVPPWVIVAVLAYLMLSAVFCC
ncbi:hypothetical protein U1Q18_010772, partial [Sarracenia purpurea var. burkii]